MPPVPSTPRRVVDPNDPDFTPANLRVADLRGILSSHNIRVPSSARKADLVQAVEQHFPSPRAGAGGASSSQADGGRQDSGPKPRVKKEDDDEEADEGHFSDYNPFQAPSGGSDGSPQPKAARALQARKSTAGAMRTSKNREHDADLDASASPSSRAARRKTMDPASLRRGASPAPPPPAVERLASPALAPRRSMPFQNYMDPDVVQSTPPRKFGIEEAESSSNSTPSRQQTKGKAKSGRLSAVSTLDGDDGNEADVSRAAFEEEDDEGEEDDSTPASPSEGVHTRARRLAQHTPKPYAQSRQREGSIVATTLWWIGTALVVAWWAWYVRDSRAVGYCDVGSSSNPILANRALEGAVRAQHRRSFIDSDDDSTADVSAVPHIADLLPSSLQPGCTPCPPHALCSAGRLDACASSEYVLRPSLLSRIPILRSALPLDWTAATCKTDSRRLEMIDELAGEIASRLGTWRGSLICGTYKAEPAVLSLLASPAGAVLPASDREEARYGYLESRLFEYLSEMRDPEAVSSEAYFRHLWDNALEELDGDGLVRRLRLGEGDSADSSVLVPAASLASLPLTCRARLAIRSLLRAVSLYVLGGLGVLSSLLWVRARLRRVRTERHTADALVDDVLRQLAEAQLASLDGSQPAHLPASHLRDVLLPSSAYSPAARKRIWSAVSRRVESNSNVRVGMKRWKGEWSRGWEWVGVTVGGGSGSLSRKGSSAQLRATAAAADTGGEQEPAHMPIDGASTFTSSSSSLSHPPHAPAWLDSVDAVYRLFEDPHLRERYPELAAKVQDGVRLCEDVVQELGLEKCSLSFNGGKDCTVIVHMLAAVLRRLAGLSQPYGAVSPTSASQTHPLVPISAVYITCPSPFPALEDFIRASQARYNLDLVTVPGGMKEGLAAYFAGGGLPGVPDRESRPTSNANGQHPNGNGHARARDVQAIFIGTRRTDPHGESLEPRKWTDPSWPRVERIHPILDWDYSDVWAFLRCPALGLSASRGGGGGKSGWDAEHERTQNGTAGGGHEGVPYCELYDEGYTSLGSTYNTFPNPLLARSSVLSTLGAGKKGFNPAWQLTDGSSERAGRKG